MAEKFEVGYSRAAIVGGMGIYHKYILYTNNSGEQFYLRGGPGYIGPGAGAGGMYESSDSPLGNIKTESGRYEGGTPDWDKARDPLNSNPEATPHPRETISEGDDLSSQWNQMKRTFEDIDRRDIPYNPKGSNSNSAVNEALREAGLPAPKMDGPNDYWAPGSNVDLPGGETLPPNTGRSFSDDLLDWARKKFGIDPGNVDRSAPIGGDPFTGMPWPGVDPLTSEDFQRARNFRQSIDPLMLDLDGDGLELRRADGAVLFDHDADGIRTGTGWISSDDGILVRDVDGNNLIQSGRELFGVDTIKSNGERASNAFDALSDLDSNSDGIFSNLDLAWNQVKVWRDFNQDGISDAGELFGLDYLGITRIGVIGSDTNATGGNQAGTTVNGNLVAQSASFTRGGEVHSVSAVNLSAGAIDLATSNFYREFTNHIPLTPRALILPKMQGSGMVRDLAEAVSLDPDVESVLTLFAIAPTRDIQRSLLDELITEWAKSSNFWGELEENLGGIVGIVGLQGMTPDAYRRLISVLEVFNGERFYRAPNGVNPIAAGMTVSTTTSTSTGGMTITTPAYTLRPPAAQLMLLQQSYDALKESVYGTLVLQTRLKPYLNSIQLTVDESGLENGFSTSALLARLENYRQTDVRGALVDLVELNRYALPLLHEVSFDGLGLLRTWINELPSDSVLQAELASLNVYVNASTAGTTANDIYLGSASNNNFNAGAGNDVLDGGAGNDTLTGGDGADTLIGGDGNDNLSGNAGNDTLLGGTGNDTLYGEAGNDILDGGVGNDSLSGGDGSDVYRFARGWGQDSINNYDVSAGKTDAIEFAAGISASDIVTTRSGDSLILSLKGTTDVITITSYFSADGTSGYKLEQIRFADGTSWDINAVKALVQQSTSGNDTLYGYATADTILGGAGNDSISGYAGDDTLDGGAGNDTLTGGDGADTLIGGDGNDNLSGNAGNDTLLGGTGNDTLYGEAGNDILDGGVGNDSLSGGDGSDVYRFARGWGQDSINNYDVSAGKTDAIEFAAGISASDIVTTRSGDSLILSLKGTTDVITITSYFSADGTSGYKLEQIRFADGTSWDINAVKALVQQSTSGNDTLYGYATADTLLGGAGNDSISGYAGDDTLDGGAGNDTLTGGDGADTLIGGDGNDNLSGNAGNDTLLGGTGNDTLYGEAGNDILDGGTGNDSLSGGDGSDVYRFARGWGQDSINNYDVSAGKTDAIEFAAGIAASDIVTTRSGDSLILSLKGTTDVITITSYFSADGTSGYKLEQIRFADGTSWDINAVKALVQQSTSGNDTLYGYATADTILGGAGNDSISGYAGDDTLDGGAGNDTLTGGDGADTLIGGDGNDNLSGNAGNDTLLGGTGNDTLYGEAGNDILDGGVGNDSLSGGDGSDVYRFARGWGQDSINNYDVSAGKTDAIEFAAGISASDIVTTRSGDSLILSLKGTTDVITITSYFSADGTSGYKLEQIRFADGTSWDINAVKALVQQSTSGNDTLYGYATADTILGGAGNDSISGYAGDDTLDGGAGNDTLTGGDGADTLIGGDGNDNLSGNAGNDTLLGGTGNDTLYGEAGNDILDGGVGNDSLSGGDGSDVYRFARGWGQDTISNYDVSAGKTDAIEFAAGISASDIVTTRSGDSLILSLKGTTDVITITSYFSADGTSGYKLEQIRFADGTSWDINAVKALVQQSTSGNDTLYGYATADTLLGGAGNDSISGYAGDDTLDGGAGNDTLTGGDGADTLIGGDGNDNLSGNAGNDTLLGGTGNDTLYGEAGNDILDGGTGNDSLSGGDGSDVYRFARGWGQDSINNYDVSAGKTDAIEFAAGIAASDIVTTRSGDSLILSLKGTTDVITITSYFSADGTSGYKLEQIRFADGTSWDINAVKALVQQSTSGNDTLYGYATADTILGGAGNDSISGYAGDDTLDGGAGNDTLTGGDGADTLIGGDGNDNLSGNAGNDTLLGGVGNDTLYGEAGNDILDGGAGNDSLSGGDGSDVYRFARGLGQDSINNYDVSAGKTDAIEFAAGIAASDIVATRSGDSLILSLKGTTDVITITSYFSADGTSGYKLEQIRFADGTSWDINAVKALVQQSTSGNDTLYGYATADTLLGGAGNDSISGYAGDDTLDGGAGNDTLTGGDGADTLIGGDGNDNLSGNAGNDTLLGGTGNDTLYGEAGNDILDGGVGNDSLSGGDGSDVYRFARGWGQDSINNYDVSAGKTDAIEFAAGIAASDIVTTRSGDSLILSLKGTTDVITITSYFSADGTSGYKLEQIRFADGTSWDYATTKSKAATVSPPAGVTVQGTSANDTLTGGAGNDTLNGGAGADLLQGGDGNDTLNGDVGNDTLDGGAGNDALNGGTGSDTYLFGRGSGRDTVYDYDTTTGSVDTVQFGEGVSASDVLLWRSGDSLYLYIDGFNGDRLELQNYFYQEGVSSYSIENIRFADGTNWDLAAIKAKVIVPTEASDTLIGYAGNDTLAGLGGDDVIYGRAGDDTISGGAGADTLYGEEGNDTLIGGAQDDILNGGAGADLLQGGDGNDTLNGDVGNDTLDGGAGNDALNGGTGSDTYLFGRGSGRDTVYDYDTTTGSVDTVQFGEGVSASDVLLWRSGDSLYLYIDGFNGDRLELQNYFYQEGVSSYSIENIRFADGTNWDLAAIKAKVIVPTEASDTLIGYAGNDTLAGLGGDDVIYGRAGDDTISGGAGADTLYGEEGNDTLIGGAQDDILNGGAGADLLQGGDGNDTLNGDVGNDTLDGGAGNDALNGGTGSDTYLFGRGSGRDTVYDYDTTTGSVDTVQFGEGVSASDVLLWRSGDSLYLYIDGFNGDRLELQNYFYQEGVSSYSIENIRFADGTNWDLAAIKAKVIVPTEASDTLIGYAGNDTLAGLGGDDVIYGRAGDDTISGGAGADTLYGEEGNDTLIGGAQDDILNGGAGADLLQGGDGNDTLNGDVGNDTLDGGAGNDALNGGTGSDTYLFGRGSGRDTVYDYDTTTGSVDTVQFGEGVSASDVLLWRSGDSLYLYIDGFNGDRLELQNYFYQEGVSSYSIENIRFADGTNWDLAAIKAKVIVPTEASDTLIGYAGNDTLAGLGGDDVIYGRAGDDTISGGAGADTLYGEEGNDTLIGGAQDDILNGGAGADLLQGGDGNDTLNGDVGNDTLDGGAGNDALNGGTGSDTYLFGRGSGRDTVYDYDTTTGSVDTVQFGEGVSASDVLLWRSGDSLYLYIDGFNGDRLELQNYFYQEGVSSYSIENIRFADGTNWDLAAIKAKVIVPTEASDTLIGYAGNDTLAGLGGDDVIYGRAGDDTISGGAGADTLYGEEGNDTLIGGAQDDILNGGAGADLLQGGDGNDTLNGDVGNDTLDGGAGNDALNGGTGSDTYLFGRGSGRDTVYDYDTTTGSVDTVQFGEGVSASDVLLWRSGDSLYLYIDGFNGDRLELQNYFYQEGVSSYSIENIRFADGTNWDLAAIKAKVIVPTEASDTLIGYAGNDTLAGLGGDDVIYGRAGDDTISGGAGADTLYGEEGNDTLIGGAQDDILNGGAGADLLQGGDGNDTLNGDVGNDTLDGGAGNDALNGGTGSDTYLFGRGSGRDTVYDYDTTTGSVDSAQISAGVSANQLWFAKNGNDLSITIIGTSDQLTISNWYASSGYRIEQFKTSDGRVLLDSQVQSLVDAMAAFSPPTAGDTKLSNSYQSSLNTVIAANWH